MACPCLRMLKGVDSIERVRSPIPGCMNPLRTPGPGQEALMRLPSDYTDRISTDYCASFCIIRVNLHGVWILRRSGSSAHAWQYLPRPMQEEEVLPALPFDGRVSAGDMDRVQVLRKCTR